MNKFDTLVNSILEEGLMGNIKAAAKTAAKLPFKAAGGLVKKALNPAAYLRGAAGVVGAASKAVTAPGKIVDVTHQMMQTGDTTPITGAVQSGLRGAAGVLSKAGSAVSNYYQKQKTSGGSDIPGLSSGVNAKANSPAAGSTLFNLNAMKNISTRANSPFAFPRGINSPDGLKIGDVFTQINKKTGQSQAFKVIDIARDRSNIVAAPVSFYK